jgi:hypothetical protein
VDGGVALADPRRNGLELRPVGDVAGLGLGVDLGGDLLEPLRAACDEDAAPATLGQEPRGGGPDPARPSGDDGDANSRNSRLPAP